MDSNGYRKLAYKNARRVTTKTLSMRFLETRGYLCADAERKIRIGRMCRTVDLYNIGDAIAIKEGTGILMVQSTTIKCLTDHIATANASAPLRVWLLAGGFFEIHAWAYGKFGKPTVLKKVIEVTVRGKCMSIEEVDKVERYQYHG